MRSEKRFYRTTRRNHFICTNFFSPSPAPFPQGKGKKILISFAGRLRPLHPVAEFNVLQIAVKFAKIVPTSAAGPKCFANSRKICRNSTPADALQTKTSFHLINLHPNKEVAKEWGSTGERNFGV